MLNLQERNQSNRQDILHQGKSRCCNLDRQAQLANFPGTEHLKERAMEHGLASLWVHHNSSKRRSGVHRHNSGAVAQRKAGNHLDLKISTYEFNALSSLSSTDIDLQRSCSQILITRHPSFLRFRLTKRSRALLEENFFDQNNRLPRGIL